MNILIWLVVGGVIGWIASLIVGTDAQQGVLLNVIVGIVGAFVSGLLFKSYIKLAIIKGYPIIDQILFATVGAVILLLLIRLIRGR